MARSDSMQALTNDTKADHPGVVIYGIGDLAHQSSPSGHNEDDTPGSKPDQQDADNRPEHRAIDVMLGPAFTREQAWAYVAKLVTRPANRARLTYVIFDGWLWSAKNGWLRVPFLRDPHRDHPHVNGLAADDENGSPWDLDDAPAAPPAPTHFDQEDSDMFVFSTDEDNDGNEGLIDDRWAHVSGGVWVEYDNQTLGTALAKSLRQGNDGAPLNAVVLSGAEYAGLRAPYEANNRVLSA